MLTLNPKTVRRIEAEGSAFGRKSFLILAVSRSIKDNPLRLKGCLRAERLGRLREQIKGEARKGVSDNTLTEVRRNIANDDANLLSKTLESLSAETRAAVLERIIDNEKLWPPLHCAAYLANAAVITVLLANGANPTVRDPRSLCAADVAERVGRSEEICKLLMNAYMAARKRKTK
jgi:ankyrin repeat protein